MQHVRDMSYTWQYEVDSDEWVATTNQWHMVMQCHAQQVFAPEYTISIEQQFNSKYSYSKYQIRLVMALF